MTTQDRLRVPVRPWHGIDRWLYRGGRPHGLARLLNRVAAAQYGAGVLSPRQAVTLEVSGRRSGKLIAFPVVVADLDGERYLVAMLGNEANWVRNVRAANGLAVIRRGTREAVRLEEVEVCERAPILRRYLALAPGARAHFPIDRGAPLAEFDRIAADYPVFRLVPAAGERADLASA